RQLKLPEGTLSSRLATARRMLARRLGRYELALSGGMLAGVLAQGTAGGRPPGAPVVFNPEAGADGAGGGAGPAVGAAGGRCPLGRSDENHVAEQAESGFHRAPGRRPSRRHASFLRPLGPGARPEG